MDVITPPVRKIQWYDKPLMMPVRDIIKEYREAKDPKKQIDILADLNHTKPCRIAWLLDRCGEVVDKVKLPRKSQNADAPDLASIWVATPEGNEAWEIRLERKRMEKEAMHIEEAGTECPAETEENTLAWVEKALECEVPAEECPKNEGVVKEVALPEGKSVTESVKSVAEPSEEPDKPCPARLGMEKLITAEFWQIYLSHKFAPINEQDVCRMLNLAEVAKEMLE